MNSQTKCSTTVILWLYFNINQSLDNMFEYIVKIFCSCYLTENDIFQTILKTFTICIQLISYTDIKMSKTLFAY